MHADGVLAEKDSLERNALASALRRLRAACGKASGDGRTIKCHTLHARKGYPEITGGELVVYAVGKEDAFKLMMAWRSAEDAFVENNAGWNSCEGLLGRKDLDRENLSGNAAIPGLHTAFDEIEAELKPLRSGSFGELAVRLETCA